MTKVIITADVEDSAKWETGFRSHADLFRGMSRRSAGLYFTVLSLIIRLIIHFRKFNES